MPRQHEARRAPALPVTYAEPYLPPLPADVAARLIVEECAGVYVFTVHRLPLVRLVVAPPVMDRAGSRPQCAWVPAGDAPRGAVVDVGMVPVALHRSGRFAIEEILGDLAFDLSDGMGEDADSTIALRTGV